MPKSLPAASADPRRVVESAVISKSSRSDLSAGICACAAHPRSGLAPMMPTRILLVPPLLMAVFISFSPKKLLAADPRLQLLNQYAMIFRFGTCLADIRTQTAFEE